MCVRCIESFFLQSDGSCLDTCEDTIRLVQLNFGVSTYRNRDRVNLCVISEDEGCELEVQLTPASTALYGCVKCKSGFNPQSNYSLTALHGLTHNVQIDSTGAINLNSEFTGIPLQCANENASTPTPITDCDLY